MDLHILSDGRAGRIPFAEGQTLLDAIRARAGFSIHAPCGGNGTCKKCTVYLVTEDGETPVLACRTRAEEGMTLRIPDQAPLSVEPGGCLSYPADPGLSDYGIACDIGTTTVVCQLVELSGGTVIAAVGEGNAQRPYGSDVIARIKASMDGLRPALTAAILRQLSHMIRALCREAGIPLEQVHSMAVAANTTMLHLLTGLSPDSLGAAPFTPLSLFGTCHGAREMGLPFDGRVYLTPAVSGYVGGDITADLLATDMDRAEKPVLLIDVGTNGEMALGCKEHFLCCSTAAGPAFEGAQIRFGMTAAAGAISQVQYADGQLICTVLGGGEPRGICGSGLIDAIAVMLSLGAMEETGRLLDVDEDEIPPAALPYLTVLDGAPAFRLSGDICVTQSDVRKVQLGKGAIAAGIAVLRSCYGEKEGPISALLLSGGFGSYIRPESAARIGLIPPDLLPVTRAVGNTAVRGAGMALVSASARQRLSALQRNLEYKELSMLPAFNDAYLDAMVFPEEDPS